MPVLLVQPTLAWHEAAQLWLLDSGRHATEATCPERNWGQSQLQSSWPCFHTCAVVALLRRAARLLQVYGSLTTGLYRFNVWVAGQSQQQAAMGSTYAITSVSGKLLPASHHCISMMQPGQHQHGGLHVGHAQPCPRGLCSCAQAQPDNGTICTCSRGAPCAQVMLLSMLMHSAPRSGLLLSGWHLLYRCLPFWCCRDLQCKFYVAQPLTYRAGPQPLLTGQMQQQASSAASTTRRRPCQPPTRAAAAQRECQLLSLQLSMDILSLSAPARC